MAEENPFWTCSRIAALHAALGGEDRARAIAEGRLRVVVIEPDNENDGTEV